MEFLDIVDIVIQFSTQQLGDSELTDAFEKKPFNLSPVIKFHKA